MTCLEMLTEQRHSSLYKTPETKHTYEQHLQTTTTEHQASHFVHFYIKAACSNVLTVT